LAAVRGLARALDGQNLRFWQHYRSNQRSVSWV
jgi:hypothetical protein